MWHIHLPGSWIPQVFVPDKCLAQGSLLVGRALAEQPTCNKLVLIAFDLERSASRGAGPCSLELEATSERGLLRDYKA